RCACREASPARRLCLSFLCHRRWLGLLRGRCARPLPARGLLRRSHSQGRKTRRVASAVRDQIRVGHQSQDRQGARSRSTHLAAGAHRRGDRVKRRAFITLLGGAVAAWPVAARAQQKLPTIGFLGADASAFAPWTAAFVTRLHELGWIEGQTVAIEYRWSQSRTERYAEIAAEFVSRSVDAIVTVGSAVPTVRHATATIPIVFAVAIDPVGSGLVASLAKPGGNVTGLSLQSTNLAGKRLELLREVVPQLRRLAIIFNVGNAQPVLEMGETQAAARMLGLDVAPLVIQRAEDIAPAFEGVKTRADAL